MVSRVEGARGVFSSRSRPRGVRAIGGAVSVWLAVSLTLCATGFPPGQAFAASASATAGPAPTAAPAAVAATGSAEPSAPASIAPPRPGTLLFLGNKNLAPVVYADGTMPSGLAVDLARALEPHLSKPLEIRVMDWKQAQAIVASGQADALIQINATPERRRVYDFSEPLLESRFSIFVRSDRTGISGAAGLRGLNVGVESGGLPQQVLQRDRGIRLTVIPNFPEGFGALNAGKIDAVVVDYRVGSYVLATNGIVGIKAVGEPVAKSYSAIAVKKGNTALLTEINAALRAIRADGTYDDILKDWAPTEGVFETRAQLTQRVYSWLVAVLLVLLVIATAWGVTLRTQMRRKKLAEEALVESEETFGSLVASMAEGVVIQDIDGRITHMNHAAEEILGLTAKAARGRTVDELGREVLREDGTPIPPEEYPGTLALRTSMPQSDVVMGVQRPPYDELAWISVNSQPLFSAAEKTPHAVVTTFRDITEHRRAEQALRTSERKLALHLQQTLLGVIEWDSEGRVLEWNPAAEAIFGYSRDEALGKRANELIVPPGAATDLDFGFERERMMQGESGFRAGECVTKDGRLIECEWVVTPLADPDGAFSGAMSLARDVTESRQAEQLRLEKDAAEAASAAKSAFLANISHEIRTPMNAILGFSQLLSRERDLSARQRQHLDVIRGAGEQLLVLIDDLLEMSKLETGRLALRSATFDLHSMLEEMDSVFGARASARGLALLVRRTDAVPRFVVTDGRRLRQVFVNLLNNAVKYTDTGRIELSVDARQEGGGRLRLLVEVADTGRGIGPEAAGDLFSHFERAPGGLSKEGGVGLGLVISREFVRLLGGEIGMESRPGQGSVFRFDVVVGEVDAGEATLAEKGHRVARLLAGGVSHRVLVACADPATCEFLVGLLEPVGFEVRAASDGNQAVRVFRGWEPQLVIMEMDLPGIDGYEVAQIIRTAAEGADAWIIGLAATGSRETKQDVLEAGIDEFVAEPFGETEIFEAVGRLLGVEYAYDNTAEKAGAMDLEPGAMAGLPPDLLSRLREATLSADFDRVFELADEIGGADDARAEGLRRMAEKFDTQAILSALGRNGT